MHSKEILPTTSGCETTMKPPSSKGGLGPWGMEMYPLPPVVLVLYLSFVLQIYTFSKGVWISRIYIV